LGHNGPFLGQNGPICRVAQKILPYLFFSFLEPQGTKKIWVKMAYFYILLEILFMHPETIFVAIRGVPKFGSI